MSKLKYYDVFVNGRRQAVYLKGDADRRIDQLKVKNEALMKLAHDYIQAYEKLAFGDNPLIGGDDETE